ncbi:hypothetical protein HZF08_22390 [Paenibacillus sp. CGMCC 1.16610]|uniref:HicB-like antitoxin of toxin-antitoxin system domain-containing protein n=1 Tax=Paenibacillus anseongense TaxID=2682845 RepID=A0ABW9UI33_9BACL|nr:MULTISPECIES: hypothetical protein [Paenibacillus]MBA2941036.1 hypothetical protein [Paenibacillus sp. CGMCC 1.16610]MVQ39857.1 hypothetical protein [Paenibacillus anseongense]
MNTKDISYYMTLPYNMIVEIVESNPPFYFGTIQELPGCFANGKTEIELREKMEKPKISISISYFSKKN